MPLMAAYEQNDARDAARLLATLTLEGLQEEAASSSVGNAINNMYRLLLGYRSHGFHGYADHSSSDDESSMTSLHTSSDRNVGDLRHALDETFSSVFADQDPGVAIEGMKGVLKMAAYPKASDHRNPEDVKRASEFFETLLQKLEA